MLASRAILLGVAVFVAYTTSSSSSLFIINGDRVNITSFPHQVSLRDNGKHFCGGAIIGDRHIITASHCIIAAFGRNDSSSVTIHTGTSLSSEAGGVHRVAGYARHPEYSDGQGELPLMHDIAVVTLKDRIEFDERRRPARLPVRDVRDGELAVVTGWGVVAQNSGPNQLRKLDTKVISAETCRNMMSRNVDEFEVCAFKNDISGVCYGDSGGALLADGVVIGVSSWIEGKFCASGYPDVYAKVYHYLEFIRSVMRRHDAR